MRWNLDTTVEAIRRRIYPPLVVAEGGELAERTVNADRQRRQIREAVARPGFASGLAPVEQFAVLTPGGHAWAPIALSEWPAFADRGEHVSALVTLPADRGVGPRYHAATAAALGGHAHLWRLYLSLCLAWFDARPGQEFDARPEVTLDREALRAICYGAEPGGSGSAGRMQRQRAIGALLTLAAAGVADVTGPEGGPWRVRPAREDRAHPDLAGKRPPDLRP